MFPANRADNGEDVETYSDETRSEVTGTFRMLRPGPLMAYRGGGVEWCKMFCDKIGTTTMDQIFNHVVRVFDQKNFDFSETYHFSYKLMQVP